MLDPLCGAIQDTDENDCAFIHRNASFVCSITGITEQDHNQTDVRAWVDWAYKRLSPFFNGFAYQNYDMGNDFPMELYFGKHIERLKDLKQRLDPQHLFYSSLLKQ